MKETAEQIAKIDVQIERSIRMEAFSQAGELKRNQDVLIKKYDKMKRQFDKNQRERKYVVGENEIAESSGDVDEDTGEEAGGKGERTPVEAGVYPA